MFVRYRQTLQSDRRRLLEEFRIVDVARKVVGVGSVGTRVWIVLLLGRDGNDPLFLQAKEAQASVLAAVCGPKSRKSNGERVVIGQHLMQATSDIFLGWTSDDRSRRRETRLLLPPAPRLEGIGARRNDGARRTREIRTDLRTCARSGARALRRPHCDLCVSRYE